MIEVHPNPARAWSDGAQSLTPERFRQLMNDLRLVAQAVGREI
jgi:3-deoxy-7-phosphoheptulonate synthase